MFNKFYRNVSSKLGTEIIRGGGLTPVMAQGAMTAIPIWELLNITEEQYISEYEYPAFVKNQARLDAELKAVVDASGIAPFMEDQPATEDPTDDLADASNNEVKE